MFGLEGHLMIAILKVEYTPDFAVTLFLENVFDTREGMSIVLRIVVYLSKIFDQSIVIGFLLGHWEGGAVPWTYSWFNFVIINNLVYQVAPGYLSLPMDLKHSLFYWHCPRFEDDNCFSMRTSDWWIATRPILENCTSEVL
jgi:hypothetical protein